MISNPQVLNVTKPAVRPSGFGDESFNRVRPLLMIVIYDLIIRFNSETFICKSYNSEKSALFT